MKQQDYIWFFILFCLCFIGACDDDQHTDRTSDCELYFSALIDGMTPEETAYRFQGGQEVGFWLSSMDITEKLNEADLARNVRFSQSAGGLVSESPINWNDDLPIYVYGYSPYNKKIIYSPHAYQFNVNLRQDTVSLIPNGNKQSDLLWTKHVMSNTLESTQLSFHHLMCKVVLLVKSNSSMPGSLIGSKLSICNSQVSASVDLGTGIVSPMGTEKNIVALELSKVPDGYEIACEAIIIPQTIQAGERFLDILTLSGASCVWNADEDLMFESGKQVVMEVVVDEKECHVQIKEILPWKEQGSLIYGEALEDLPTFEMFDFYDSHGVQGIVIEVDESGTHGWIVSVDETSLEWGTAPVGTFFPEAYDADDAMINLNAVLSVDPILENYPAMKWCNDKNINGTTGWVLPAHNVVKKLAKLISDQEMCKKFNQAIENAQVEGASIVNIDWNDWTDEHYYASSTLSGSDLVRIAGCSCMNGMFYENYYEDGVMRQQGTIFYVRAFKEF